MSLTLPTRWQGCEHVVACLVCLGSGCRSCGKRGVNWNRQTLPENMLIRGYSVKGDVCYYTPSGSTGGGFPMDQSQVCANIWHLDGVLAPVTPAPLWMLDRRPAEDQAAGVAQVGGLHL